MSDPDNPDTFDVKWQAIKAGFIIRLPQREARIDGHWTLVREHRDADGQALHLLFHEVHSLAGSAATFGFEALGDAARALEMHLDRKAIADTDLAHLDVLFGELRVALQYARESV